MIIAIRVSLAYVVSLQFCKSHSLEANALFKRLETLTLSQNLEEGYFDKQADKRKTVDREDHPDAEEYAAPGRGAAGGSGNSAGGRAAATGG